MKLHIVPAHQGVQWAKLGVQTFFRQPLALAGLLFMCAALLSLLGLVPFIGGIASTLLMPGLTLGLMAASREAGDGKFPMPSVLITAFRAGRPELRAMLILGALYGVAIALVAGASALVDGGKFVKFIALGEHVNPELLKQGDFLWAALIFFSLCVPVSMLFWHAPALVHWYRIPPLKSLFFSVVACMRNVAAFTVYGLVWAGLTFALTMTIASVAAMTGKIELAATLMYPAMLMLTAMFITSVYFTFRDNFEASPQERT